MIPSPLPRNMWSQLFGGTLTNFPTSPHQFTVPGNFLEHKKSRLKNVKCIPSNVQHHLGHPPTAHLKFDLRCPQSGSHKPTVNSCKTQPSDRSFNQLNRAFCSPEASQVSYLIQTCMNFLDQKNMNFFNSISIWEVDLPDCRCSTFLPESEESENFIFAFQYSWQKSQILQHGQVMVMLESPHNTVDNFCLLGGRKVSLYTIMIHDPIV
ncbi:hypothetical protein VP01_189g3 [Puccinia sorghi]|uniref:Uncharacterized protein n=1 Tax=Puccinia sorghi TaxID=27349 RepID=A0A0L6VD06_9BASI|nr:hypothetical protein VP01_189g3 [Puccinia sorghi]